MAEALWFLGFSILVGSLTLLVKGYLNQKGANLATKEDIRDITNSVEAVKAAVSSRLHGHQVRYEHEVKILMELSERMVAVESLFFTAVIGRDLARIREVVNARTELQKFFLEVIS